VLEAVNYYSLFINSIGSLLASYSSYGLSWRYGGKIWYWNVCEYCFIYWGWWLISPVRHFNWKNLVFLIVGTISCLTTVSITFFPKVSYQFLENCLFNYFTYSVANRELVGLACRLINLWIILVAHFLAWK
jgi:hypothetical protein